MSEAAALLHRDLSSPNLATPHPGVSCLLVEKQVDPLLATRHLKKWAGLCKSSNTAILHLPIAMGGLNLPRLSPLHKKLQVSRQCQLLLSRGGCVHFLADRNLRPEVGMARKKFKLATFARDIISTNPGGNSKSLSKAAKRVVNEDDDCVLLDNLPRCTG